MNKIDRYKILIRYVIDNGIASSQKDFGQKLGYSNESSFSQIINGKVKEPKDFMSRIGALLPDLNNKWLQNGEGEMLKSPYPFAEMSEEMAQKTISETIAEELMKLLKREEIYLAKTHNRIVSEKNEEISSLRMRIEELQKENWELQRKVDKPTNGEEAR